MLFRNRQNSIFWNLYWVKWDLKWLAHANLSSKNSFPKIFQLKSDTSYAFDSQPAAVFLFQIKIQRAVIILIQFQNFEMFSFAFFHWQIFSAGNIKNYLLYRAAVTSTVLIWLFFPQSWYNFTTADGAFKQFGTKSFLSLFFFGETLDKTMWSKSSCKSTVNPKLHHSQDDNLHKMVENPTAVTNGFGKQKD